MTLYDIKRPKIRYLCSCEDGFMGKRCEAIMRWCSTNPCLGEHAICVEKPQGI